MLYDKCLEMSYKNSLTSDQNIVPNCAIVPNIDKQSKSVPKCSCGNRQWGIGAILQPTSLRSTANRPPWPRSRPTPSRPPHPLPQARLRFTCQGRSGARQLCDRARPAAARPWRRRAHPPNSTRVRAHSARAAAAPPRPVQTPGPTRTGRHNPAQAR